MCFPSSFVSSAWVLWTWSIFRPFLVSRSVPCSPHNSPPRMPTKYTNKISIGIAHLCNQWWNTCRYFVWQADSHNFKSNGEQVFITNFCPKMAWKFCDKKIPKLVITKKWPKTDQIFWVNIFFLHFCGENRRFLRNYWICKSEDSWHFHLQGII